MTIRQEKWLRRGIAALLAVALLFGIIMNTTVFAADDSASLQSSTREASMEDRDNVAGSVEPTFTTEEEDHTFRLKAGINLVTLGNDVNETTDTHGIALTLGNNIHTENSVGYGFIAGNEVNISSKINKDLFAVGNIITITEDASVGGDVFIAANEAVVNTSLPGDLAVTASVVRLSNISIAGNLDLSVEKIVFDGDIVVGGTLTYNDDAVLVGLDNAEFSESNIYHIERDEPTLATIIYDKFISAISLIFAMVIIILIAPNLHPHLEKSSRASAVITDLSLGAWFLLLIPIAAIFLICLVFGLPLALILFAVYLAAIYLSQGFAGAWVGHILIEKVFKSQANIYIEVIVGIIILAALSLVPYVGEVTGIIGTLLGIGLMLSSIKPKLNSNLNPNSTANRLIAHGVAKAKDIKKNRQPQGTGHPETPSKADSSATASESSSSPKNSKKSKNNGTQSGE